MNKQKMISAIITMGSTGSRRKENWFFDKGLVTSDLDEAVKCGYLIRYEKNSKDFLSDAGYELTQRGRDFAWK